jgi:hypothetical protein
MSLKLCLKRLRYAESIFAVLMVEIYDPLLLVACESC